MNSFHVLQMMTLTVLLTLVWMTPLPAMKCVMSVEEPRMVMKSYLAPHEVLHNYTCCPNLSCDPPVCSETRIVLKRAWRVENITITRNISTCCKGFVDVKGIHQIHGMNI